MALYCAAFSPTGTSLRGAWAMALRFGGGQLLDVTTLPRPRAGVYPPGLGSLWGARCTGAGCSRAPWSASPPCGARTPPALSPSPMATGILTDALLELTRFCQGARLPCPLLGPPWWGSTPTAPSPWGPCPMRRTSSRTGPLPWRPGRTFRRGGIASRPRGTSPTKEGGKGGSFTPSTTQACTHCGLCVRQCPMQAIGEDCAAIDGEKCIACFRCVKNCPVQAKGVFTPEYQSFAAAFSEKLKEPQGEPVFSGQGLNFPGGAGGKRGFLPPRAAGLFSKATATAPWTRPWNQSHKKQKSCCREQQLFFTLENLPHRTWRRRISLTPST